jgi:hypothetical protein
MLPAVDIEGPVIASVGIVKGYVEDQYYSQTSTVGRTCTIRLHSAPGVDAQPRATATCSWTFADLVSGVCYGTDELKGVRVRAW